MRHQLSPAQTQQYITQEGYEVRKYIAPMMDFNEKGLVILNCRLRAISGQLKALHSEPTAIDFTFTLLAFYTWLIWCVLVTLSIRTFKVFKAKIHILMLRHINHFKFFTTAAMNKCSISESEPPQGTSVWVTSCGFCETATGFTHTVSHYHFNLVCLHFHTPFHTFSVCLWTVEHSHHLKVTCFNHIFKTPH